jgi:hypothetical protein
MGRTAVGLGLLAGLSFLADRELVACGDKLLVMGRHVRSQRAHGAVQRASILVLLDAGGHLQAALRDMRLQRNLELAGHTLKFVTNPADLVEQVRSGTHDILMTDVSDAGALRSELMAAPGTPVLLPVVVNATGNEWAEAQAEWSCITRSTSATKHYLAMIEEVLAQRRVRGKESGR